MIQCADQKRIKGMVDGTIIMEKVYITQGVISGP
jgi:hypothetical protein